MVRRAVVWLSVGLVACNAIADNGKYEVVDCPSGSCADGGGSSGSSGTPPPAGSDSGGGGDAGVDAKPTCMGNEGRIALTVAGTSGSVDEDRGLFSVSAGSSKVVCVQPDNDQLRLRTSGGTPSWAGVQCGTTSDCRFGFHAGDDLTVTATFP